MMAVEIGKAGSGAKETTGPVEHDVPVVINQDNSKIDRPRCSQQRHEDKGKISMVLKMALEHGL